MYIYMCVYVCVCVCVCVRESVCVAIQYISSYSIQTARKTTYRKL